LNASEISLEFITAFYDANDQTFASLKVESMYLWRKCTVPIYLHDQLTTGDTLVPSGWMGRELLLNIGIITQFCGRAYRNICMGSSVFN